MDDAAEVRRLGYRDLFAVFLRTGLGFGGGLGILAILEEELISKRRVVSKEDFLALYGLGRIVPSGTMTALAVAYGYRFGGLLGTVVALTALSLPAFASTIALTVGYAVLRTGPVLELASLTLLPGALALIVIAALRLGKHVFRPSVDFLLAAGAFVGALVLDLNPALLLVLGGIAGAVAFGRIGDGGAGAPAGEAER